MTQDGTPHSLTVTMEHSENKCIVQCVGDLVGSGCAFLQAKVSELLPDSKLIVLDLADLEWIDSMGLGTLVRLHVICREAGCRLQLDNVGKRIRDLLCLTNLLGIFA
jgi:anti-sigma B factor antagonist